MEPFGARQARPVSTGSPPGLRSACSPPFFQLLQIARADQARVICAQQHLCRHLFGTYSHLRTPPLEQAQAPARPSLQKGLFWV